MISIETPPLEAESVAEAFAAAMDQLYIGADANGYYLLEDGDDGAFIVGRYETEKEAQVARAKALIAQLKELENLAKPLFRTDE